MNIFFRYARSGEARQTIQQNKNPKHVLHTQGAMRMLWRNTIRQLADKCSKFKIQNKNTISIIYEVEPRKMKIRNMKLFWSFACLPKPRRRQEF